MTLSRIRDTPVPSARRRLFSGIFPVHSRFLLFLPLIGLLHGDLGPGGGLGLKMKLDHRLGRIE